MRPFYHNALPVPVTTENKTTWYSLHGSSASLAVATLALRQATPILVIAKDLQNVAKLTEEIGFFLNHNPNNDTSDDIPILNFPDWETLPYDHFSPHQDLTSQRLATLYRLPHLQRGILITAISTLMQRLPPRAHIESNSFVLQCGDQLAIDALRQRLEKQGYTCVSKVMEHGEFAVRGSLIDIFPMGSKEPLRIDLFDNQVDSIRIFDSETQLTTTKITSINLLPAKEFPLSPDAIARFRQNWRTQFSGDPTNCSIYQNISNGESAGGIEYYLPIFFNTNDTTTTNNLASLYDYLPKKCLAITIDNIYAGATHFWEEVKNRHHDLQHDVSRPILPPAQVFLPVDEVFAHLKELEQINVLPTLDVKNPYTQAGGNFSFPAAPLPNVSIDNKASVPLAKLTAFAASFMGKILLCAESRGRLESLLDILRTASIQPHICADWQDFLAQLSKEKTPQKYFITVGALEQGFSVQESSSDANSFALIAETDFFGQQVVQQRRHRNKATRQIDPQHIVRDLIELCPDSPVVHIEHGIGRYLGLQTITTDGVDAEFLAIEYANNAKLYVPIGSLHLISRYTGTDPDSIPYNTLGSDKWAKAKRKALEKIRDIAAELLGLYAQRAARPGFAFTLHEADYHKFTALFPFEETPDQEQAIAAVINDMTAPRHMDRLICGDVGFGKTEVAMRATFIAVNNNKQVAVLVPTTILAQQHYLNFKDRFAEWPFEIELISRVRSAKEQTAILDKLKEGKIDIIVGTHKLLQPNIHFKDLGLLVIDEEHRFGVKQKERLKTLRPEVDMLTLTATPIPRTLNMAFAGIRDFSIIATPPARRLAIKTFIHERENAVISEAIWREVLRGGQVYFLHNDVATIEKTAQELAALIPSLRITVAHGQMRERQLENIMTDFYHQRFNVLVCTTIIESGIDVPTANTIIIDRADRFGLSQLHQLRGRVGRSHHQAYSYLLVPSKNALTKDAERRLEAITAMEDLGAGFNLATHDLEIRGAGELLGDEQSGHIENIGFTLYMEYLEDAVKTLQSGKELKLEKWEVGSTLRAEIEIHKLPMLFPDEYIHDIATRLTLYKRLTNAQNIREISTLKEEVVDRFGRLPPASHNLFRTAELKLKADALGIRKITAHATGGLITFNPQSRIEPGKIIELIQKQSQYYQLRGPNKLAFSYKKPTATTKINAVNVGNNQIPATVASPTALLDHIATVLDALQ